ncbi:MAG: SurA N-terminal domain-containing protein [Pseudomonadales bacterium]|nr:SurA N-terminal domain-containing protein [Pseudomonadales bacterium]
MLQKMRENTQSLGFKILVGAIIFVLAVFGFGAFNLFLDPDPEVASVGGIEITESHLAMESERARARLLAQMGENADPAAIDPQLLRSQVLDQLIQRAVLTETADELGVVTPRQQVDRMLVENPSFQTNGKFDQDLYVRLLAQYGYTPKSFAREASLDMAFSQMQDAVTASSAVPRWQVRQFAALLQQKRDLAYLPLTQAAFGPRMAVTEDEIVTHYDENRAQYRTDEKVDVDYVEVTPQNFADDPALAVSEADVEAAYEGELKALAESEQRTASHILLRVTPERDDAATLTAMTALRARIEAGEDFAAVARETSEDPGSAPSGGELGPAGRGVYDPAFEQALFAMQEGELSAPVKSQFGYHLIHLTAISKPEIPTLDARREDLERQVRLDKARELFVEKTREMDKLAFEQNTSLQPLADLFGVSIQHVDGVTRQAGEGIFANAKLRDAAFGDDVVNQGLNSAVVEYEEDKSVVLRISAHHPSVDRPLEDVREDIRAQLVHDKAADAIEVAANDALEKLKAGASASSVAHELDLEWVRVPLATRSQQGVPTGVLEEAFALPYDPDRRQRAVSRATLPDGQALVTMTRVVDGDFESLVSQEADALTRYAGSRLSELEFTGLYRSVEKASGVTRSNR